MSERYESRRQCLGQPTKSRRIYGANKIFGVVELTVEKMKEYRWLRPQLVGQFEYVEWTPDEHLRRSRFVGPGEDVAAGEVRR